MSSETNTPRTDAWEALNERVRNKVDGEYGLFTNADWQNISTIHNAVSKLETELAAANAVIAKMREALRFTQAYLVPATLNEEEIMSLTDAALRLTVENYQRKEATS